MTSGSKPGRQPSYPVGPIATPDFEPYPRAYVVIMRATGATTMWRGTLNPADPAGTPVDFAGSRGRVIEWAVNQVGPDEVWIWSDERGDVVRLLDIESHWRLKGG